jgi:hypothetical protein
VYLALNEIRKRAKRLTGKKCIYFKADNSTSKFGYTFQESLIINSVKFEPSLAYKHSLIRVIEQVIGIIAIIVRLIIYKAKLLY